MKDRIFETFRHRIREGLPLTEREGSGEAQFSWTTSLSEREGHGGVIKYDFFTLLPGAWGPSKYFKQKLYPFNARFKKNINFCSSIHIIESKSYIEFLNNMYFYY